MTVNILGHKVEVTTLKQCKMSGADHDKLKHEARVDRQANGFNVDDSFVLCGHCGEAISLFVEDVK